MTGGAFNKDSPARAFPPSALPLGLRAEKGAQILQRRVLLQPPARRVERAA